MAQTPTPPSPEHGGDPAMDDILASIRQILTEEDNPGPRDDKPPKDVLALDPSMMTPASAHPAPAPPATPPSHGVLTLEPSMMAPAPVPPPSSDDVAPPVPPAMVSAPPSTPRPPPPEPKPDTQAMPEPHSAPPSGPPQSAEAAADTGSSLIAPKAAAAAASSLGELVRKLSSERTVAVHRGGPTIEDLVREELRPLLKEWLDTHLPGVVERLVRMEIERVVGHTAI